MLPKTKLPIFSTKLPSTGSYIEYRPYTVKEEKILMIANESGKYQEIMLAIRQILQNCVTSADFDVDKIPQFDIEFLFLQIYASSKADTMNPKFTNRNCSKNDGKGCGKIFECQVNLRDVPIEFPNEDFSDFVPYNSKDYGYGKQGKQIKFSDGSGVLISYPTFEDLKVLSEEKSAIENAEDLLLSCIRAVFDDKTVYYKDKDFDLVELRQFIEGLTTKDKTALDVFMNRLPILRKKIPFSCDMCEFSETATLTGLRDFLA